MHKLPRPLLAKQTQTGFMSTDDLAAKYGKVITRKHKLALNQVTK